MSHVPEREDRLEAIERSLSGVIETVGSLAETVSQLIDAVTELQRRRSADGNFRALMERRAARERV